MNFKNFKDIKCIPSCCHHHHGILLRVRIGTSIKIDDKIDSFSVRNLFLCTSCKSFPLPEFAYQRHLVTKVPILHFTGNALLTFTASTKQNLSPITQLLITSFERGYAQLNHLSLYYLNALTIDILTSADDGI